MIIDNTALFSEAERTYQNLNKAYEIVRKSERSKKPIDAYCPRFMIELWTKSAFEIDPQLREVKEDWGNDKFPDFNEKLKYLTDKGFLNLEDEELSVFDPVTKDEFYKRLFDRCF